MLFKRKELIVAGLLLFFAMQAITSLWQESATWDETHYFGVGNYLLKKGQWDVPGAILHPPLSFYIHSIPFLFVSVPDRIWEYDSQVDRNRAFLGNADIFRGQALLNLPANRGNRLLNLSRSMMVLIGLLLGYFVYRFSYVLYGVKSGLFALALFAFSPNMLAHTRLITPDIVVTAFCLMTVYYLWLCLAASGFRYAIFCGLSLGLALLSKFTALMLVPVVVFLWLLVSFKNRRWSVGQIGTILSVGFAVFYTGYRGNLSVYTEGLMFQLEHQASGHASFLLGNYSLHGWWYYFIVAFLLKTPVYTVILFAAGSFFFLKKIFKKEACLQEWFLVLPIIVFFVIFSLKTQAIGLRYILLIYPFIFIFISGVISYSKRRIYNLLLLFGMAWYIGGAIFIYPHYLAYFNELGGGPSRGYHYLVDSNLDWGQDLKGLGKYVAEKGINEIYLSYFGTDLPERYEISYKWLPSMYLYNNTPQDTISVPHKAWVAISATNLQGVYFKDRHLFDWLKALKPTARIGYSLFVYHLD